MSEQKLSWFGRLKAGLQRSSAKLTEGISAIFTKRRLDDDALEELEEALIAADLGVTPSAKLVASLRKERFGKDVTDQEVREHLARDIAAALVPIAHPLPQIQPGPQVVLVVGVNGSGKTTTIGKLAAQARAEGRSVLLVAGDTFRAAAVEQLRIWASRTGATILARDTGADAAALAFDAVQHARAEAIDLVLIDTAGRLHNKTDLMQELAKVVRVLKKADASLPHQCILVLDATTGQNALQQVDIFRQMVQVSGLVLTKLDGSSKGGVLVALAERFGLPVHAIGVGETADDLRPFDAESFAKGLLGLERG
ncbi:MAG: signal recognition particle-docking protein FtsY [Alphaproteobacteria bacterium]|nr:signal recognition particle-docking protein FtsY [Alphaproteobacteria bacterium]TAD87458.1 MAG: signal recognition particle-docking protein FtsY [Alphaproteobacteria bacterium]